MFPFFSVLGRSAGDIVAAEARWRKSKMLRLLNMRSKQKLALCETLVRAIGHWEQFAHDAASINVGYRWLMFAIDVSRGNGGR